jgi:hypothetical protein
MPDYIGLYYPHITFPSDAWVKLAAFYWDKLGRIVPPGYQHRDSDTVQRLQGELGFVEDFEPAREDTSEVGKGFMTHNLDSGPNPWQRTSSSLSIIYPS